MTRSKEDHQESRLDQDRQMTKLNMTSKILFFTVCGSKLSSMASRQWLQSKRKFHSKTLILVQKCNFHAKNPDFEPKLNLRNVGKIKFWPISERKFEILLFYFNKTIFLDIFEFLRQNWKIALNNSSYKVSNNWIFLPKI